MAVWDCFTFYNELDILELRCAEMAPLVDHFVLVEATTTFSGEPKPLYFAEARDRFARWADKIVHVVVDDMPKGADAWDAERFQRDACVRGIETAAPDDLILLSDVDEIPKPEVLARVIEDARRSDRVWFIEHEYREYKLNWRVVDKWVGLCATRCVKKKHLPSSMQEFRAIRGRQSRSIPHAINQAINLAKNTVRLGRPLPHTVYENSGWHFTFMSDVPTMQQKIRAYAHQERNTPEFNSRENLERLVRERKSICGRPMVDVRDDELPRTVRENRAHWAHLLG